MRSLACAVFLLFALDVHAVRFDVVRRGEPIADAEVCLFRAAAADDPIARFFASSEVRCAPASTDIDLAAGRWNAFARKGSTLVSERVELVTAEDARVQRPRLEVVDAAAIDATAWKLDENGSIHFWIPSTRSAIPFVAQSPVPASTIVPLVIRNGAVVRIGAPMALVAGETRKLDMPDTRDAVVPIVFRSVPEGGGDPPDVGVIDARGTRHRAIVTLDRRDVALGATLLFFRELPSGALTAEVGGKRWKHVESSVSAASSARVAMPAQALEARTTSKVTLHWWTSANLAQLASAPRQCVEEDETAVAPMEVTLRFCGDDRRKLNKYIVPRECLKVAEKELPFDAASGDVTFEDVTAGAYYVVIEQARIPSLHKSFDVVGSEATDVDMELRWFRFYGKVTRDGQPVAAELYGTVSDGETGHYEALLPRNPKTTPQTIRTCDGTIDYRMVPDEDPVENAAFDIEIAQNRIVVEVVDAKTQEPIEKAMVFMAALMDGEAMSGAAHFAGRAGTTDADGRAIIEPVLPNKRVNLCAESEDYERSCVDPFKMEKAREKTVRLELQRLNKRRGQIIATGPIENGQLVWVSRDGKITEMVRAIEPDGRFIWTKPHASDETLTFIAANQPLFAMRHPAIHDDADLILRMPNAPRRTFRVFLSEASREGAFLALRIGDAIVSINTLGWHQMNRRMEAVLEPGHSVVISDILMTDPIRVILVPQGMLSRYPEIEMPFVPEMGSFPQQDLASADTVNF